MGFLAGTTTNSTDRMNMEQISKRAGITAPRNRRRLSQCERGNTSPQSKLGNTQKWAQFPHTGSNVLGKVFARMDRISDWGERAREANWCVQTLAAQSRVSVRTLERWFRQNQGTEPRKWLKRERLQLALELLKDGSSVKETASKLGYQTQQHFSRDFKKYHSQIPSLYSHSATA